MTKADSPDFPQNENNELEPADREQRLANAVAGYLDLQCQRDPIDLKDYCRLYPDLAPDLRAQLEALGQIDTWLEPPANSTQADPGNDELPESLSGHKILGEIGSGGMGRVLLAMDPRLERKVAIKTLKKCYLGNAVLRARFMQESRAMARISHPHIVQIYHLGQPDEDPHFVMEYVEGVSVVEAAKALTLRQKAELLHKVVLAVDFLHQHQVIHRDLKPGNILVGSDLEPKVLDFGLALQVRENDKRLTLAGEVMGTPDYFSPEQASGRAPLDSRSDVFSLGIVLYELLTGTLPFRGETISEQIESICEQDPPLLRRINPSVPGDLQNVCLKALEKDPSDRYRSAREMANDLERFLAGEPVLAAPTSYSRLLAGKIEQHLRELNGWTQDHILSNYEFDAFRKLYDRLIDREDAWIMEVRRLTLPQVSLYLGAWITIVAAVLAILFHYSNLKGTPAVLAVAAATASTGVLGIRGWKQGQSRIALPYLLAFCLLLPSTLLVMMNEYGWFAWLTQDREDLEFLRRYFSFERATNAQLWWAILLSLPAYYWLRRFTRASVFSLVVAVMMAQLGLVTLLRMGMLEWLDNDPGKVYFHLIPIAAFFFVAGFSIERLHFPYDSRYFYPFAVVFTYAAMSGVAAFHEPYAQWLKRVAPWTRGQVEYLFMINALIYVLLQYYCGKFPSAQLRSVAKAFRFVVAGHVLLPLLLLGIAATDRWNGSPDNLALRREARIFEVILPLTAGLFAFLSIPKQMKNYFVTGLVFVAIGIIRLQKDYFNDKAAWPLSLLLFGLLLMLIASYYTPLKMFLIRAARRKP